MVGSKPEAFDVLAHKPTSIKALLDSGLRKIPNIFVWPSTILQAESHSSTLQAPVIDLTGIRDATERKRIVEQVGTASGKWGIFQVVNHGIPQSVLDGMIEGLRKFNEQDEVEKRKYYSKDLTTKVRFHGGYDLDIFPTTAASWRDTLAVLTVSEPDPFQSQELLPPPCRHSALEFSKHVDELGNSMLELLSEALGLETDHLRNMGCSKGQRLYAHYYPACPEPEVALGIPKHSDAGFLTMLLQNQITSGFQVLYEGQWVDIPPVPGALIVNIADLLQVVSNGRFKSAVHRAIAQHVGPRISAGYFFSGPDIQTDKTYGPIKELLSKENPPVYRDVPLSEHRMKLATIGPEKYCVLDYYKV